METNGILISLQEVLTADIFHNCRIFAGRDHLDNLVRCITISDVPDELVWLTGGELICTTGYILHHNPDMQERWLENAAKGGAAGIVIKPERFLGFVPEKMIETANRVGLPLIGVPITVLWADVIQQTMGKMLDQQVQRMKDNYEIHHRLEKAVLESQGVNALLTTLSQIVGCAVAFDDPYFTPIGMESVADVDEELQQAARLSRKKHATEGVSGKKREQGYRKWLIPGKEDACGVNQVMIPVIAGKQKFGWLSAFPVPEGQQDSTRAALEHGATAVALEQLRTFAGMQPRTEQINRFFHTMLTQDGVSAATINDYAQRWNADLGQPSVLIQMQCVPKISDNALRICIDLLRARDKNSLISVEGEMLFILYHPTSETEHGILNECKRRVQELIDSYSMRNYQCHAGIGEMFSIFDQSGFRRSYREAALCVKQAFYKGADILGYTDLGVARLLTYFENYEEFGQGVEKLIAPLLDWGDVLVHTLLCYIANGFNKKKAAQTLCVHVNTVIYRLEKISDLLGLDINNVDDCIFYYVAISTHPNYLERYLQKHMISTEEGGLDQ